MIRKIAKLTIMQRKRTFDETCIWSIPHIAGSRGGGTSVPTPKQKRKSYITNILIYLLCKNVNTLSNFPNFIPQTSLHFEKKARSVAVTLNVLCICQLNYSTTLLICLFNVVLTKHKMVVFVKFILYCFNVRWLVWGL